MKTTTIVLLGLVGILSATSGAETGATGVWIVDRRNDQEPLRTGMVLPKSPAQKAGIESGWFLIAVNGTNVARTPLRESMSMLRGDVGTAVTLELADPMMSKTNRFQVKRGKAIFQGNSVVEITDQ